MAQTTLSNFMKRVKEVFPDVNQDVVLDPLTKILNKKYICEYAKMLIEQNIPFSIQITDIDNFKKVNDNYGHQVGDIVLMEFSKKLVDAVGDKGLVGRYGGDEYLSVVPNIYTYDDVHDFIAETIEKADGPLRRSYQVGDIKIYITGTVGSASYPLDDKGFDELLLKADKALYRGKSKGRNCYIVYVHSKHKDIEINKIGKIPLHHAFIECHKLKDSSSTFEEALKKMNDYLVKTTRIAELIYVDKNNMLCYDLDMIIKDEVYFPYPASQVDPNTNLAKVLKQKNAATILILKNLTKSKGYYILIESLILRIWQNDDIALLMYISEILNH